MDRVLRFLGLAVALAACSFPALAQNRRPWPAGDEIGMANTLGPATWQRCATYLANPAAKAYELSFARSKIRPCPGRPARPDASSRSARNPPFLKA